MQGAAHFRSEAAKCRTLAKIARGPMTARNLLDLASDYEAKAKQMELDDKPRPSMPAPD